MSAATLGSSPLTRGKHPDDGADGGGLGLIPTHAGKTNTRHPTSAPGRAHPHSRGENPCPRSRTRALVGSSPLTRGKRLAVVVQEQRQGLIPTHAGKTRTRSAPGWRSRAHPHSRGENHGEHFGGGLVQGSSPLTRGKPLHAARELQYPGLIPTHAGKTNPPDGLVRGAGAHPHSRGENTS